MTEQYHLDIKDKKMHECFDVIILQEDTKYNKPRKEPLLSCARKLGVKPKKCLYVGDTYNDYKAATDAKMDFALASWGNVNMDDINHPTYILKRPNDLIDIINNNY